jgi:hypothetical protein
LKNGRSGQARTVEIARDLLRTKVHLCGSQSLEVEVSLAGLGGIRKHGR